MEKEETSETKTAYRLITSNIKEVSQMYPYYMNELHVWKDCYPQPKRKLSDIEVIEKEEMNANPKKDFTLISSNMLKGYVNPEEKEKWIGDSGATVHITNSDVGIFNVKKCSFDITEENQETTKCTKVGDI